MMTNKVTVAAVAPALLLVLAAAVAMADTPNHRHRHLVPAVYVFGDSLFDVGNNNYLPGGPDSKVNRPPYGIDYPGGKPTGRFSNGFNVVDFLSQKLGFKESPPAALSVRNRPAVETNGLNFASGGSGVLDTTSPNLTLPMNAQLELFRRAAHHLSSAEGEEAARRRLARSLFVLSTGSNDLFSYAQLGSRNDSQTQSFTSSLVAQLGCQLRTLNNLGAKRFAVFGAGNIGCVPLLRQYNPKGECMVYLNSLANDFNAALKRELQSIAVSPGSDMEYSFVDTYAMVTVISKYPKKYGFKDVVKACCGSEEFYNVTQCFPNSTYCAHRDEYALWDWTHLSQATNKIVADWAYDGTRTYVQPINIHSLIE